MPTPTERHKVVGGAHATCRWHRTDRSDLPQEFRAYLSFGWYLPYYECDSFGVPDNEVFFYTTFDELESVLCSRDNGEEFYVVGYELREFLMGERDDR